MLRLQIKEVRFTLDLTQAVKRRILRTVGAKVATRIRRRWRLSKDLVRTGELRKSLRFRLRRGDDASGTISPAGVRPNADTHKARRPLRNFSVGAFHAAKRSAVPWEMTADDEAFFRAEVEREVIRWIGRASTRKR